LLAATLLSCVLFTFHLITIQKQAGRGKEIKHLLCVTTFSYFKKPDKEEISWGFRSGM